MRLEDFIEQEYGDIETACAKLVCESVVPAICTNPDCDYVDELEPDARNCKCPECETNTVQSVVELLMF